MSTATDNLLKAAKAVLESRVDFGNLILGAPSNNALRALAEAVREVEDENRKP